MTKASFHCKIILTGCFFFPSDAEKLMMDQMTEENYLFPYLIHS